MNLNEIFGKFEENMEKLKGKKGYGTPPGSCSTPQ